MTAFRKSIIATWFYCFIRYNVLMNKNIRLIPVRNCPLVGG